MKTWIISASLLATLPAAAGNPWITRHDAGIEHISELGAQGAIDAFIQASAIQAFGESRAQIAVVSYDRAASQNQMRVFDKQTRQLLATWPVQSTPVSLLSGAAPDIVLLEHEAYVLTHATNLVPNAVMTTNSRGGRFNVVRIALRTGETVVLPLGDAFANPRLSNFDGVPVVTDWAGYAVWRLSADGTEMSKLIGQEELSDILPAERTDAARRSLPNNARADFVAVPGAGVFRMSKFGVLHRVAGADLAARPAPHASLALGPAADKERLLAATSKQGPAIAVVQRAQERRTLAFIDAATLSEIWRRDLPAGVSVSSMVSAGPDSVMYIDQEKGALLRMSRDGTQVVRELPANGYLGSARILSAGNL